MSHTVQDSNSWLALLAELELRGKMAGSALTPNDSRILGFVISHPEQIAFMAAENIADSVGVSRAAVVRFAAKLGFAGYGALRQWAQAQIVPAQESPLARFRVGRSEPIDEARSKCERDAANLDSTWKYLQVGLVRAAADLSVARNVLVVGNSNSYGLAHYFHRLLHGVRDNTHILDPGFLEQFINVNEDDAVVIVIFSRYSETSLRVLGMARRSRARTVLITDRDGPALGEATHILRVATDSTIIFRSMVAAVSTLEGLAAHVAASCPEDAKRRLEARERLATELGTYRGRRERRLAAGSTNQTTSYPSGPPPLSDENYSPR